MTTPISTTWQADARRKWLSLEADATAANGLVRALTDRRSYLSTTRAQAAEHLGELERAVIRPDSTAGYQAHENRIAEARAQIESLDSMLCELATQIQQASELSTPQTRLACEARRILQKLNIISKLEAAA